MLPFLGWRTTLAACARRGEDAGGATPEEDGRLRPSLMTRDLDFRLFAPLRGWDWGKQFLGIGQ